MILLDKENKLITLHTQNTTYQMKAWAYDVLLHTYQGHDVGAIPVSNGLSDRISKDLKNAVLSM